MGGGVLRAEISAGLWQGQESPVQPVSSEAGADCSHGQQFSSEPSMQRCGRTTSDQLAAMIRMAPPNIFLTR